MPTRSLLRRRSSHEEQASLDDIDRSVHQFLANARRIGRMTTATEKIKPVMPRSLQDAGLDRVIDRIDVLAAGYGLRRISPRGKPLQFKKL